MPSSWSKPRKWGDHNQVSGLAVLEKITISLWIASFEILGAFLLKVSTVFSGPKVHGRHAEDYMYKTKYKQFPIVERF